MNVIFGCEYIRIEGNKVVESPENPWLCSRGVSDGNVTLVPDTQMSLIDAEIVILLCLLLFASIDRMENIQTKESAEDLRRRLELACFSCRGPTTRGKSAILPYQRKNNHTLLSTQRLQYTTMAALIVR